MAELLVIAGVSITVPMVLKAAGMALQAGYDIYMAYDNACERREQVGVCLARCKDILQIASQDKRLSQRSRQNNPDGAHDPYISRSFNSNTANSNLVGDKSASQNLTDASAELERACKLSTELAKELKKRHLGWYILFGGATDKKIEQITKSLNMAVEKFGIKALLANFNLQKEIAAAQAKENKRLELKVNTIADMDAEILVTLKEIGKNVGGIQKVMAEVLECKKLLEGSSLPQRQAEFVRRTTVAVTIASKGHTSVNKITIDMIASAQYAIEIQSILYNEDEDYIGQGGFGTVFKAKWDGVLVAIKKIHKDDAALSNQEGHISILQEVGIWKELRHPNILSFYGTCVDSKSPIVVMEYCKYGNVISYLRNPKIQTLKQNRIELAYNIACGINYLHDRKIVHSDLKGVNILVNSTRQAVLADFGLSSLLKDIRTRSHTARGSTKLVGTPHWTAPEVLDGKRMSEKSDIYSMGLTIWELFSEESPYEDLDDVNLLVNFVFVRNRRPERPANLEEDDEIWKIIQKCWDGSPDLRPPAKEVQADIGRLCSDSIEVDDQPDSSVLEQKWRAAILSSPPRWTRGNPKSFIDALIIPEPPSDKRYRYRVMKGEDDLGIRPTYERDPDGSQRVNLLEYHHGYGISDRIRIRVYAGDEVGSTEMMIAEWPANN